MSEFRPQSQICHISKQMDKNCEEKLVSDGHHMTNFEPTTKMFHGVKVRINI